MFLPLHDRNPIKHIQFPFVTYGLIGINLFVYMLQATQPIYEFNATVISLGIIPVELLGRSLNAGIPDWQTLVTYQFLHGSWLHVLSNMLFLWIFGDNIEDALGHVKFVIFYIVCGIGAGLAHAVFNAGGYGPLVGASGSVAGLMGAYIVLFPHARVYVLFRIVIPIPLPLPAVWMLAAWFGVQLFSLVAAGDQPIAWWAHIGGMIIGAALVVPLRRREVELFGGR
jgi:membrane associated rhomboid family serine protease